MKPSAELIEFLASWEGPASFVPREDPCAPGVFDVGYGHLCKFDHATITPSQALDLLASDVERAAKTVDRLVLVSLTQNQYDAIVSLVYNIGVAAFERSTMLKYLNNSDFDFAANEFQKWNKAGGKIIGGLIRRRAAERAMFVFRKYDQLP